MSEICARYPWRNYAMAGGASSTDSGLRAVAADAEEQGVCRARLMTYFSRALHKVLVLASNTGSYLTAVAWLQAGSNTVGGLSPFALDGGTRHLVGLFVFTCFVTWVVWHSLNWLVEKQLGAAQV